MTPKPKPTHRILPRVPRPLNNPYQHLFNPREVEAFLYAFGDSRTPLPSTIRVLDEIVTDYIIETCHEAAAVAHHARRQKIKLDDFKFMLRRDTAKLGRVMEMVDMDKELKRKRKAFDTDEGAVAKGADGDEVGEERGGAGAGEKERGRAAGAGGAGAGDKGGEGDGERKKKKKKKKDKGRDDASTVRSG